MLGGLAAPVCEKTIQAPVSRLKERMDSYEKMLHACRWETSPDRFAACLSVTCHFAGLILRPCKGETVPSARCRASRASVMPYFHPSRTGIDSFASDSRKN